MKQRLHVSIKNCKMPQTELIFYIINFFSGGISWTWTLKERWFIVKTLPQISPLCHHFPSFYSSAGFLNWFLFVEFVEFRILNWTRFLVQLKPSSIVILFKLGLKKMVGRLHCIKATNRWNISVKPWCVSWPRTCHMVVRTLTIIFITQFKP